MTMRLIIIKSLLLTGVSYPALAQNADDAANAGEAIEEIVVQSTRRPATPISKVTRSVSVVTAEELEVQTALERDAGSILAQKVPGFSPSTQALSNFGQQLRGRNFQTLIDGVPQDTSLRNGQRSLQTIDIEAVEQIEVFRGGTAIYGFGADGGLINYITKRPEAGALNVSGRAGLSFSTVHFEDSVAWNTHLQLSGRTAGVEYLVGGTFVSRNNTFDADGNRRVVDPIGAQGGLDESDEFNVLTKLAYQIDGDQRVKGTFNIFSLRQDADFGRRLSEETGQLFASPFTPEIALPGNTQDEEPGNESTNVNLVYDHADVFGSAVKLQGYYQQIDTIFTLFPGFPQTEIESEKVGARLTVNTPVDVGALPFEIAWGMDYLGDETGQFQVAEGGTTSALGDQDAFAGFGQIELPIGGLGLITAGVRHEAVSIDVTEVAPSGELSGSETLFNASASAFLTDWLTLFGGLSQSFSPGDILRVITDGTFSDIEQVELEFVQTDNYEAGLRATFDRWEASAVGFFSESDNGTTFDADLNIVTQPEEIWGFETTLSVRPIDALEIGGTFSLIYGRIDLDNDGDFEEDLPTTRIPPEKITGFVDYRPLERWRVRAQVIYSGTQSNDSTAFGGGQDIDDYTLFDLYTTVDIGPGTLEAGVTNLFNNSYLPVINQAFNFQFSNVRGPGRRLSFAYKVRY